MNRSQYGKNWCRDLYRFQIGANRPQVFWCVDHRPSASFTGGSGGRPRCSAGAAGNAKGRAPPPGELAGTAGKEVAGEPPKDAA